MLAMLNDTSLDLLPTRVTHNTKSSTDFVCSNVNEDLTAEVIKTSLPDNQSQVCTINLQIEQTAQVCTRVNTHQITLVTSKLCWE